MAFAPSVTTTPAERRATRLDARYALWELSSLKRVRACGRYAARTDQGVTVKASGAAADGSRVAGLGGVQSCGSVWACPVCAQKVQAARQAEVASALAVARRNGWEVLFLTLTMRHGRDHRIKRLWDHLTTAWAAVTTGAGQREWKADREDFGIVGYLRLVEVTHGYDNGWHVHAHVLLFCDPSRAGILSTLEAAAADRATFTDSDVNDLGTRMFLRWRSALNVKGIRPTLRRGVDIRRVRSDDLIAEYFAKQVYSRKGESSTAHDVTGSHGKDAKNGNRTPFGILRSLVNVRTGEVPADWSADGYDRDLALWHAFEAASKGRRQLLWARGFRALLGLLDDEQTDQEIVDEEIGGDVLVTVPADVFKRITACYRLADLLYAAEADDTGHLVAVWLTDFMLERPPALC